MAQDAADVKAARDAASKYGRVNRREYSKLAGTPMEKARRNAKRVTVSEYAALTASPKQPPRKAHARKRVAAK